MQTGGVLQDIPLTGGDEQAEDACIPRGMRGKPSCGKPISKKFPILNICTYNVRTLNGEHCDNQLEEL